jgi:triosephosphate isomerase
MNIRKPLIAGNWKMNLGISESVALINDLKEKLKGVDSSDILICPSFTALEEAGKLVSGSNIRLGAQNICYEDKGAFTGEISGAMLKESGCSHVIIGHSERRHLFKEPDEMINNRVKNAIKNGLHAIFCVGETLAEREKNKAFFVIEEQIKKGLAGISSEQMKNVIIAYEPVWAIGTGKNATPEQAQEIHVFIRDLIKKMFSEDISFKVRILYGGSVKPDNIKDLMMQSDIDGALVGGASLKSEDFCKIVKF